MSVAANNSNVAQVTEFKLYTGIDLVKVLAINPTLEEAKALKLPIKEEPKYVEGEGKVRIDFHVGNDKMKSKISVWLENKERASTKNPDKYEYINNAGATAWSDNGVFPGWYKGDTARKALVGESTLISVLINWLNVKPGDNVYLDKIQDLFTGNVKELREILSTYKDNSLRVLLTVRDGKYQSVYTKYFDRETNKTFTYWSAHFKKQAEADQVMKEDYQNSFEFKEYVPVAPTVDAQNVAKAKTESVF